MSKSVAAVVVTFNRKTLLAECVDALLSQQRKPDKIFVVDNASTDGTEKFLMERGLLDNPLINYVRLDSNTGGAGGFHEGSKLAYEAGFDWIWVMDDDAEPDRFALKEILNESSIHPDVDVFSNLKVDADGEIQMNHFGTIDPCGTLMRFVKRDTDLILKVKKWESVFISFASFVGLFFSRRVVASIGLPLREMFIHQDDLEYCTRIQRKGFKMLLIPKSIITHKEAAKPTIQNSKITFNQVDITRLWINYFGIRNAIWYKRTYCSTFSAIFLATYLALKFTLGIIFFRDHKIKRIAFRLSSIRDGLLGKFDNQKPMEFRENFSRLNG